MSYIAKNPGNYAGQVVRTGQCVPFVEAASGSPIATSWTRGIQVKNNAVQAGTAIATFDPNGRYGNHTGGRSHAAIFVSQDAAGILVWDQWIGQPVHQRTIRFQGGARGVKPNNDGDAYYVIE